MPAVNLGSSIVTTMPVLVNQGGAMDTVSQGETVTRVPGSTDVRHLTGLVDAPGGAPPSAEELARRLRDTAVGMAADAYVSSETADVVKLDANENPYSPPPEVGCGADELIDLLMRCTLEPGDAIVDCPPTFTMYAFDAAVNDARVVTVPRLPGFATDVEGIRAPGSAAMAAQLTPDSIANTSVESAGWFNKLQECFAAHGYPEAFWPVLLRSCFFLHAAAFWAADGSAWHEGWLAGNMVVFSQSAQTFLAELRLRLLAYAPPWAADPNLFVVVEVPHDHLVNVGLFNNGEHPHALVAYGAAAVWVAQELLPLAPTIGPKLLSLAMVAGAAQGFVAMPDEAVPQLPDMFIVDDWGDVDEGPQIEMMRTRVDAILAYNPILSAILAAPIMDIGPPVCLTLRLLIAGLWDGDGCVKFDHRHVTRPQHRARSSALIPDFTTSNVPAVGWVLFKELLGWRADDAAGTAYVTRHGGTAEFLEGIVLPGCCLRKGYKLMALGYCWFGMRPGQPSEHQSLSWGAGSALDFTLRSWTAAFQQPAQREAVEALVTPQQRLRFPSSGTGPGGGQRTFDNPFAVLASRWRHYLVHGLCLCDRANNLLAAITINNQQQALELAAPGALRMPLRPGVSPHILTQHFAPVALAAPPWVQ
ncbi:hypothetical protein HT031_000085 [Scenedesmus sp. PABB004]|nr:hypothetical protein HT031_000085 [Scenedesmus sp. PABB004]